LRIVFTSHYALPHLGGIEVFVDALALALTARGHDVTHIASASRRADDPPPAETVYRLVRVPAWNPLERRFSVPVPFFAPSLRRAVARATAGADIVHAHGMLYAPSRVALRAASRRGLPRLLTEQVGFAPYASGAIEAVERAAIATIGKWTASMAQAIIVLNDRVAEEMRRLAPRASIVTIGNGIDLRLFAPPSTEERQRLRAELGWDATPRALFVGRLAEKKGAPLAIEAARLGAGAFRLAVAGPGDPPRDAANVDVLGALPHRRLAEIYRAADVFVLPSHGEGFPITAQEAMASGLPAILGDDTGYGTTLAGAGAGARLVPREAQALASTIADALRDPHARGDAARFAQDRFSLDHCVDEHLALYERLRAERR
jgi:D-inositol-3-phosphate glycosyltransferase